MSKFIFDRLSLYHAPEQFCIVFTPKALSRTGSMVNAAYITMIPIITLNAIILPYT